jgi:hypothetical protein
METKTPEERLDKHSDAITVKARATNGSGAHTKVRFPLVRFKDLKPGTAVRYLIKPIIPSFGLTLAWGPPKCGKSFWTFDAMMHVALGRQYRDHKVQQGTVVYCAFEGAEGFKLRAEAFRRHHNTDADVPFYLMPVSMDLIADRQVLIDCIRTILGDKIEIAAIVLDTLNRSLNGSESDDEDMANYVRAADELIAGFNCAVILVHHCGHDGNRPRGHSSLLGAVDAQIAVTRNAANNIVATVERMKDGPEGAVIASRLENLDVGTDDDDDPQTSCVIIPVEGAVPEARERQKKLSDAAKIALRALVKAINEGGEPAPASNHIPLGMRVVSEKVWRDYAYKSGISDGEERAKQTAFKRASQQLLSNNYVGTWNGLVWLAREP